MRFLVIGGSGVIGFQTIKKLKEEGHEVFFTYFKNKIQFDNGFEVDIRKKDSLSEIFQKTKPEIVIHTTSITDVDLCERDNKLATDVNVLGTSNVIKECEELKSKLVYISTAFVFDGTKSKYSEEDPTSPATFYGITKEKSEQLVKNSSLSFLILRTDLPYCFRNEWQHTNSVIRVLETIRSGKTLKEITDWYNKPTFVPNFVDAMIKLLNISEEGIFHITGADFINRYDFSLKVAEIFELEKEKIEPIESKILRLSAQRVNVDLEIKKIEEKTKIKMLGIEEGLIQMKNSLK